MQTTILEIAFFGTAALLLYVYFGYSALMALAGVLWRPRWITACELPTVSLLIPAYNESAVIADKLTNALALDYPAEKLEIIVGDDCSADATVQIARGFENDRVRVRAFPERRGKASVLNDLVREACGDVLFLCDANVMFASDALRRLVARLANPRVGAATGNVRLQSEDCNFGTGERLYYWLERTVQLGESAVGSLMGVDGGMYVIRKELFRELPRDTILDDFVISMQVIRQGSRVVYEPLARAEEGATPSARTEFRRRVRISAGAVQSILRGHFPRLAQPIEFWQCVSHKWLRWCVPGLLVALLVLSACLASRHPFYLVLLVGQLAAYGLAIAGAASLRLRQTLPGGVAFYFAMSYVAMLVGTAKGLFVQPSGTWAKTERKIGPACDVQM